MNMIFKVLTKRACTNDSWGDMQTKLKLNFVGVNLIDATTTVVALRRGAPELNPIGRFAFSVAGGPGILTLKLIAIGLIFVLLPLVDRSISKKFLVWANILYSIVCLWNLFVLFVGYS